MTPEQRGALSLFGYLEATSRTMSACSVAAEITSPSIEVLQRLVSGLPAHLEQAWQHWRLSPHRVAARAERELKNALLSEGDSFRELRDKLGEDGRIAIALAEGLTKRPPAWRRLDVPPSIAHRLTVVHDALEAASQAVLDEREAVDGGFAPMPLCCLLSLSKNLHVFLEAWM